MLYLDSSAFVKLIHQEPETDALRAAVAGVTTFSSELLACEASRAATRIGSATERAAERALGGLALVPISREVLAAAARLLPADLRSLDAIHLATALRSGERLSALVTYDRRLADAAEHHGLRVLAPV